MSGREHNLRSCLEEAVKLFKEKIGANEMPSVAVYAPGRVNLIGEHTDYNDGCVLPMVCHVTVIMLLFIILSGHRSGDSDSGKTIFLGDMSCDNMF